MVQSPLAIERHSRGASAAPVTFWSNLFGLAALTARAFALNVALVRVLCGAPVGSIIARFSANCGANRYGRHCYK
jgi:hypothetical protein